MEVADHESDEFIVTRDMRQRKGIMDERIDAFLALPGGIGTLEELVEVWTARTLNMHHKPVVVLDPWDDYHLLREQVAHWSSRASSGRAPPTTCIGPPTRMRPSTRSPRASLPVSDQAADALLLAVAPGACAPRCASCCWRCCSS